MEPSIMKEKALQAQQYLNELFGVTFNINVRPNTRNTTGDPFATAELYQTQLEFEGYIPGPGRQREIDETARERAAAEEAARAEEQQNAEQ